MARGGRGRGVNAMGRSLKGERFVPIPYGMAESAAWRSLSGAAVKVYVELRRRYSPGRNGDLSLSLEEGKRLLGLGKATVARALAELEAKGFVAMTMRGHWYGRKASTYAATDRERGTHPPSNAWKDWRPAEKQSPGPVAGHDSARRVRDRTEGECAGSATEPVRAVAPPALGSETDHLYSFTKEAAGDGETADNKG